MIGCIFNYVARDMKDSWLTQKKIKDEEWYIRYLNSVYFSFITMVTVGYGDITPISVEEKLFVICMTVYSCGAFGYIVSSIGNIFTEIAQKQATYKKFIKNIMKRRQLTEIVHYMRNRNIDQEIQVQVFQYLQYLEQMDDYNHQKGEQIVQKLSPQLQSLIKKDFYYPFLQKTNIFKLNFSEQILIKATLKMKELTFGPGQVIFEMNECDNRIYYILKGEVQLSRFKIKLSVKDEIDNCFGVTEFFSGEPRGYSAKSKTVTQIVYLEMNEFKSFLKEEPLEYVKYQNIPLIHLFMKKINLIYLIFYEQKGIKLLKISSSKYKLCRYNQKQILDIKVSKKNTIYNKILNKIQLQCFKSIKTIFTYQQERFCQLREQIVQTKLVADQACFFCGKCYHTYELCPFYTLKHQKIVFIEKSKVSIPQIRKEFKRGTRQKSKCLVEIHLNRIHLKAIRLNYINNSIIDKVIMIQLIEQTLFDERDIDFYRNYEAFELRLKDDGSSHYAHLIANDKVAEEFFYVEDEVNENNTEIIENPLQKFPSRINTIQGIGNQPSNTPVHNDDFMQKVPSISSLMLNHHFQKKNSFTSQITQNQTGNNLTNPTSVSNINNSHISGLQNDRYSLFKQGSMQNNTKTNNQSNSAKRLYEQQSMNSMATQQKIPDEIIKSTLQQLMKNSVRSDNNEDTNLIIKQNSFFGIENFDTIKEYTKYYPKSNFSNVLSKYIKYSLKISQVLIKKKKRSQSRQSPPFSSWNYVRNKPYERDRASIYKQQIDNISKQLNNDQQIDQQLCSPSQIYSNFSQIKQSIYVKSKIQNIDEEIGSFSSYVKNNSSPKRSLFKSQNEQSFIQKDDDFSFYQ